LIEFESTIDLQLLQYTSHFKQIPAKHLFLQILPVPQMYY